MVLIYDGNRGSSLRKTQTVGLFTPEPDSARWKYELVGDPLVISEHVVLVDAVERKSGESCRVRIPLNLLKLATEHSSTYAA